MEKRFMYANYNPMLLLKRVLIVLMMLYLLPEANGQQFNTDNYITMPHGTGTFILTNGVRNASTTSVFTIWPRFELNFQATLFWENEEGKSGNRFTTNVYGKYMFWENENKNGGGALFLGVGRAPGYYMQSEYAPMHRNYWTGVPVTIPLFNGVLSWDLMPGGLVDIGDANNKAAWGFSYSSRMAIYKVIPQTAIVGEYFGVEGDLYSVPEYKIGLRWEPNYWIVVAATYGSAIRDHSGAGFEIGVMIFSPSFLTKEYFKKDR